MKLDVTDSSSHREMAKVDIGYIADRTLKDMFRAKKCSEREMFCIKSDAKKLLLKIVVKLLGNCPLQYALVRNLGWLNPQSICAKREQCIEQLKRCLAILTDSKLFSVDACEDVVKQFKEFSSDHAANPDFVSFEVGSSQLDIVLSNSMGINKKYPVLWTFAKKLLLLSHGQASVERGFSLNKEIMVDNMLQHTLIAQRTIVDYLKSVGGVQNVSITKDLLISVPAARQRDMLHIWSSFIQRKKKVREQKSVSCAWQKLNSSNPRRFGWSRTS